MSAGTQDGGVAELARQVRELADRYEIAALISRLDQLLDEQRFDDLRSVYTDDVTVDFPMSAGQVQGVDVLADFGRRRFAAFERTQHLSTNHLIELDGDRATVRVDQISIHVQRAEAPGSHFDAGVVDRFEAVRTTDGWRLARAQAGPIWTSGDEDLS